MELSPASRHTYLYMQGALQAADRAILAYYGRGHPLAATNLPHELYEVCPTLP